MKRLLLCTAAILALFTTALSTSNAEYYFAPLAGEANPKAPPVPGDNGCWSASKADCRAAPKQVRPQARVQRIKQPRR
jgi:hypothetical protein